MDNTQQPQIAIPQEIRNYLESLIAEAGVPVFDEKTKEDLVLYLFDKLDKYMAAKIVENLSPEDTDAFIKLNQEKKPQEEIDAFLKSHMDNPEELFTRAFIDFRDFYLTAQQNPGQPTAQQNPQPSPEQASVPQETPQPNEQQMN